MSTPGPEDPVARMVRARRITSMDIHELTWALTYVAGAAPHVFDAAWETIRENRRRSEVGEIGDE